MYWEKNNKKEKHQQGRHIHTDQGEATDQRTGEWFTQTEDGGKQRLWEDWDWDFSYVSFNVEGNELYW